ncbi:hypothetical protein G5714_021750 [Onychostoma macrolepis]|uniref:Uncharacterized protein n=1 Tax=Onychostoma macrolepis TaxID=369639 RepID=A0A7J6BVR5_9TELE|nr:hypothetical protein G5714_021750 [Onychostoma macrolepis]
MACIVTKDYIPTYQDVLYIRSPTDSNSQNRMEESLSLFYTTIHSPWFANSFVILLLNKMDILVEKIQFSDLKTYFSTFEARQRNPPAEEAAAPPVVAEYAAASLEVAERAATPPVVADNAAVPPVAEDDAANRMKECLLLFYNTIHSPWFDNSFIILFLNEMDIMAERVQFSDLKTYSPQFKGKCQDVGDALQFTEQLHKQKATSDKTKNYRMIYSHFISATDTNNIQRVLNDVKYTIPFREICTF